MRQKNILKTKKKIIADSRKSMLVDAYNKYKQSRRAFYEDDFFYYNLDDDEFDLKIRSIEKALRFVTSIPTIATAALLAYLGLRS